MSKNFTLGADPELMLSHKGKVIYAENVIANYEKVSFGGDHNGRICEVRPKCSPHPLEIVHNIHKIFINKIQTDREFLKYDWHAGSSFAEEGLGGHIHFGVMPTEMKSETACEFLDNYVGSLSLLIENKKQALTRRHFYKPGYYGCKGDWRKQDWGFEYRVLSSWITSPYVAAAMLCLAKTVMYEALNNPKFKWNNYVNENNFLKMETSDLHAKFPKIWADIQKMTLYCKYKPYIDFIHFLITNKFTWFPKNKTLKESWGIIDLTSRQIPTKLNHDSIWHKFKIADYEQPIAA